MIRFSLLFYQSLLFWLIILLMRLRLLDRRTKKNKLCAFSSKFRFWAMCRLPRLPPEFNCLGFCPRPCLRLALHLFWALATHIFRAELGNSSYLHFCLFRTQALKSKLKGGHPKKAGFYCIEFFPQRVEGGLFHSAESTPRGQGE